MPQPIKYTTTNVSNSVRLGNIALGVNDTNYGPSSTTSWAGGVSISSDGYDGEYAIHYLSGTTPRVRKADTFTLTTVAGQILGTSTYASAPEALSALAAAGYAVVNTTTPPNIVTNGLVFYSNAGLIMSYPRTNSVWYDISGNTNNGTLTNGPTFDSTSRSIVFDGTDDYVNCGNGSSLNILRTVTMELWFKVSTFGSPWTNIFGKMNADGDVSTRCYSAFINSSGYVHFTTADINGQNYLDSTSFISTGVWYHWVGLIDRNTGVLKHYVNGVLNATGAANTTDIVTNSDPLRIGYQGNYYQKYNGNVSFARLYNRVLSESEILQNYFQGNIVTDGLNFALDAGNLVSYPSTGTNAYNLTGSNVLTAYNGLQYKSGNGGYFLSDGIDDCIITPDASNLDLSTFTLEGWVWWNQHKNYASLFVKGPGGSGNLFNYCFFFYSYSIVCGFGDGSAFYNVGISLPTTNAWHHIVGTYDGSTLKFYLDGVLTATQGVVATPYQNSYDLNVIQPDYPIDGRVAVARTYNRALSASEVFQNFNAQRNRFNL
jgi:hypothetical protein